MESKNKIINIEYIDKISTNPNFIKKIFLLFKKNVHEFGDQMNKVYKRGEFEVLADIAHKARSSVMILGMKKQADNMKSLELDLRKNKNSETYKSRISEFIFSCESAIKEIEALEKDL